jgi:chemotaxis protein MotB
VKSAIAGYFQDPLGRADEYGSSIMPGDGAQAATARLLTPPDVLDMRRDRLQNMAEDLKKRLEQTPDLSQVRDHIEIELTEDGLRIQLLEDSVGVFFETGRPIPSPKGHAILALLGSQLGKIPNPVLIEGYTDARPYSGDGTYSNWELSADRANNARRILSESGLRPHQVQQIRGWADRQLRVPADPYSPRNRRITITVLLSGFQERGAGPAAARAVTKA